MKKTIILALAALLSSSALAAVQSQANGPALEISIKGPLNDSDAAQLSILLGAGKLAQYTSRTLLLEGEGGDPEAAMKMGRLLRDKNFSAQVMAGTACMGACVFLLAAAAEKQVQGTVGVSLPAGSKGSDAESSKRAADTPNRYRKYFAELGVPVDLGELVLNTPPGKVRLLNPHELVFYRLHTRSELLFDEEDNVGMAKRMGLSLGQYLQFKELLVYKCDVHREDAAERAKCLDTAYRNFLPSPGK